MRSIKCLDFDYVSSKHKGTSVEKIIPHYCLTLHLVDPSEVITMMLTDEQVKSLYDKMDSTGNKFNKYFL